MKNTKTTGIGFLLNYLHIPIKDMANYIHVDRSLVSKWKNGTRQLNVNSTHFNKIVEYIYLKNDTLGMKDLEHLFYPNITDYSKISQYEMKNRIIKFILKDEIPAKNVDSTVPSPSSFTYISNIIINEGMKSKGDAILNFFDIASKESPCTITLIYAGTLDILFDDIEYKKQWVEKILHLLDKGFHLDFIYSFYDEASLLMSLSPIVLHKNCTISRILSVLYPYNRFGLYILENKMVILSLNDKFDEENFNYCNTYIDSVNINAFSKIAKDIKKNSKEIFTVEKLSHLESKYTRNIDSNINNIKASSSFFYDLCPDYIFMNEELAYEVIKQTYQNSKEIRHIFELYKSRKNFFKNNIIYGTTIHFYPLVSLANFLTKDEIIIGDKNSFSRPYLKINNSQFQLFLKDLADALKKYPNFNISLNSNVISPSIAMHRCHCIPNHKLFIFNSLTPNEYHLSTDIPFINSIANMFQQQYICSGFELSNKASVIDILNSL